MHTYPFKENKYTRWYLGIIESRRSKPLPEDEYGERHHVIPKSFGGTNSDTNLVKLSAREHFVCHQLLVRMTDGKDKARMVHAAHCMIKCNRRKVPNRITSRAYKTLREQFAIAVSDLHKGRAFSDSHRRAISESRKGKHHTEEWKVRMSVINKGRKFGPEHGQKTIATHTGRKRSDETKERLRQARAKQQIALKEWTLQKPNGEVITVTRLKEFCQTNKLGLSKLLQTQETKKPVDNGYSTGWMILSVSGGHKKLI